MTDKTDVIFRKFKTGEIIALFPGLAGTNDVRTCANYMHVGQHGSGEASTFNTLPARASEYADLKAELTRMGYDLNVINAITPQHREQRRAQL